MTEYEKTVDIDNRSSAEIPNDVYDAIQTAADAAASEFELNGGYELSVSIVDKKEIRELNGRFRGVDSVTDVLSFPMEEQVPSGVNVLGDVVICYERACEQAEEYRHGLMREISYLTVHSVLHLMGFDHITEEDKAEMRTEEKLIMKKLGIFKDGMIND